MRTSVVIDDELVRAAMKASGLGTKRAAVEAGLRLLSQIEGQKRVLRLRGKVHWEGDLDALRPGRIP